MVFIFITVGFIIIIYGVINDINPTILITLSMQFCVINFIYNVVITYPLSLI